MSDEHKTKAELIAEVADLRRQLADLTPPVRTDFRSLFGRVANTFLADPSVDPIFVFGRDVRFLAANARAAAEIGTTPEQLVGKSMYDVFPPAIAKRQVASVRQVFESGQPRHAEETETQTVAGLRWYNTSLVPVRDGNEDVQYVVGIARDVTDRKSTDEALRKASEEKSLILGAVSELVVYHDANMRMLWANRAAGQSVGLPSEQLPGHSCHALWYGRPGVCPDCPVQEAIATGAPAEREMAAPDGRLWHVQGYPVRGNGGEVVGAVEVVREVTEQRAAEQALREGEARYRAVVEDQTEFVGRFTADGHIVFMNEAALRFLSLSRDEAAQTRLEKHVHPDDLESVWKQLADLTPESPTVTVENRNVLASGEARWVQWINRGIFDGAGRLVEVQAVGRDITEQRKAEQARRRSDESYRALFEQSVDGILVIADGRVVSANQAYADLMGRPLSELIGAEVAALIHPDDREGALGRMRRALSSNAMRRNDQAFRIQRPDGTVGLAEGIGKCIDWEGRPAIQAIVRDVTEKRLAEEALTRSAENYRALFEESIDGILVVTGEGIVRANQAFADICRATPDSILGRSPVEFVHPEEQPLCLSRIHSILDGTVQSHPAQRYRAPLPDGTEAVVEVLSQRIDWEGKPALQAIVRDITERVRLEEDLHQALKMEAVGQLAGGIAHDFNNLMTGILCHASLLKMNDSVADDVREAADVIERAARRAAELTSQLLGFARRGKHRDMPVDLNATVEACVSLLSGPTDPRVRLHTRFGVDRAIIRGDPVQLEQVVLNLAMNARDAMPEGGEMTLATDVAELADADCAGRTGAKPGRYVVFTAQDTGEGIPPELIERIFEPFFTTKPHGKGTGMGLAMVYGIVKNHGGWVEVQSEPGHGSTFRIFLPLADEPAEAVTPPSADADTHPRRTGRILVVDDEEMVRNVLVRMLAALGYDVAASGSGGQAVDYYAEHGRDVALVIIDLRMAGMDGRQCFQALKRINPDVRAVLSTGWSSEGTVQDILDEGLVGLIRKPYRADELADAVRRALAD